MRTARCTICGGRLKAEDQDRGRHESCKRGGIPTPEGGPTRPVPVALYPGDLARLDALAEEWGLSRSAAVRRLIDGA
jgi:hypothetical protein